MLLVVRHPGPVVGNGDDDGGPFAAGGDVHSAAGVPACVVDDWLKRPYGKIGAYPHEQLFGRFLDADGDSARLAEGIAVHPDGLQNRPDIGMLALAARLLASAGEQRVEDLFEFMRVCDNPSEGSLVVGGIARSSQDEFRLRNHLGERSPELV